MDTGLGAVPVMLVVASAFMHAAWNLVTKRNGGIQACMWRMQLFIVLIGAVPACLSLFVAPSITARAGLCLLGSGVSCSLYYVCLARSYESEDFTAVYPAVRAIPLLVVGLGDALRGHAPTPVGWLGMVLVAIGCLFVPLSSFTDFRLRHYWKPVSLWILLSAAGTVGYSLFDKIGTEAIQRGPHQTAVYCYLFFVVAAASYMPLGAITVKSKLDSTEIGWRVPALAGTLCFLAYWLVLWAYQMTERASYVVAFRQFSIVIGVVVALFVLAEPGKAVRLTGSIVITLGLILVKLFGG
jgi:drug/metabolite transporter (DMT)-like permease